MTAANKRRVLLADDEKHVRQLIKAVLMPLDCEIVAEAENGGQALELYKETRPDVAFLDISMPVKDGIAALGDIVEFDPDAVVVMLTSISDLETIETAIKLGASHYIRKDTSPSEMREILKDIWQQHPMA